MISTIATRGIETSPWWPTCGNGRPHILRACGEMQLRAIPFLVWVAASLTAPPADAAECPRGTLTGQVTYVRDGDTIEVGSMPIRLNGLAAPEGDEPGGAAATTTMTELVRGRTLRCELDGERTHDRCVGVCFLEGADISEVMIQRGVARDCPRFSGGRYAQAERDAAANGATIRASYRLPGYCTPR
jgi:endonuclease YncB( thermonuclease family)